MGGGASPAAAGCGGRVFAAAALSGGGAPVAGLASSSWPPCAGRSSRNTPNPVSAIPASPATTSATSQGTPMPEDPSLDSVGAGCAGPASGRLTTVVYSWSPVWNATCATAGSSPGAWNVTRYWSSTVAARSPKDCTMFSAPVVTTLPPVWSTTDGQRESVLVCMTLRTASACCTAWLNRVVSTPCSSTPCV